MEHSATYSVQTRDKQTGRFTYCGERQRYALLARRVAVAPLALLKGRRIDGGAEGGMPSHPPLLPPHAHARTHTTTTPLGVETPSRIA